MDGTRIIMAGSFIDGKGADVRKNVFLAVHDGIITAIGSAADLPSSDGTVIDDFSHCTIMPALVDCSVSLSRSPSIEGSVRLAAAEGGFAKKLAMLGQHIRYCHAHGVLGVADNDDISDLMGRYQEGMAQENIIDIRIPGSLSQSRQNDAVRNRADCDYLKIAYSTNIEDEGAPYSRLSHEELGHILQHRGKKKVIVVANGRQQVKEALAAGCDAIEQGYAMGEDNLRKMADEAVLWIPSILRAKNGLDGASSGGSVCCRFSTRYVAPGKPVPGAEAFWKKMLAEQLTQLRFAEKLGVKTAVGTGAGSVGLLHGESMVEEMKLFIKAGYSLEKTIQCASENGAGFFGMEKLGALALGRKATFLLTRGSVKQLPRKLSYLEGIYVDGAPSVAYHKNPSKSV
ncbi:MAG: amidohydrolase family protein [Proteobacteria bacterium]|nr:amidohydrolase family protein [Pseudomonadota bacterium]MBU1419488.1 amidohydrolase family protein [Pseudomonadota bacterium]MBU1455179.1 amidohydrolase family protein [Pseudomonadota bacterium]